MSEQLLPPGLVVEQELTTSSDAKFGIRHFIVRDHRWNASHPPGRQVRVFPELGQKNWGSKLQERLEQLFERPLPHVSRPLEIAETVDGKGTYVVTDWHECALAMRIAERGLVDDPSRALAWKLLGELAEGLDALHGAGLPHGALCPDCVGVDLTQETAWIDGAAWAPLRHWTSGDYVPTEAIPYQAPECQGRSQDPSEKSDLYALGRIGIEMVCGSQPNVEIDRGRLSAENILRRAGIGSIRRNLLLELISAEATSRPRSAAEVVKRVREAEHERMRRKQRAVIVAVAICAIIALACLGGCIAQMAADRNFALAQAVNANIQVSDLRSELDRRKPIPPAVPIPGPAPDQEQKAAATWKQYADENADPSFDRMGQALEHDKSLQGNAEARRIVLAWHADFVKSTGRLWTLRVLDRSKCDDGSNCISDVDVLVGDKRIECPFGDDPKTWSADFNWSVGEPIKIELYDRSESKGWWPFTGPTPKWEFKGAKPFRGPVPLWLLKRRKIYAGDGNAWVDVEIEGCPGPAAGQQSEIDPKRAVNALNLQISNGK
jgi:hypothetical protein